MTEQLLDRTDSLTSKSLLLAESMLGEKINLRAELAAEQSDFLPTPELQKGLEGYYQDHYTLAGMIDQNLEPQSDDKSSESILQEIIDYSYFTPDEITQKIDFISETDRTPQTTKVQELLPLVASVELSLRKDPENPDLQKVRLKLLKRGVQIVFAEQGVGVTTVSGKEKALIISLAEKINQAIESSGYSESIGTIPPEDALTSIEEAQEGFWQDCRFAGQLLFHNSSDFNALRTGGEIMTRRMQQKMRGETNAQTIESQDGHMHSPTVHWSESFDHQSYRGSHELGTGGTIALPLERIVQFAPFARDAEYGVLTLKPEVEEEVVPKITINDTAAFIGAGEFDQQGARGIDRTFYASPHDVPPSTPLEEAPDGYSIPIDAQTVWVQLDEKDASRAPTYGYGENWPQNYPIKAETTWQSGLSTEEIGQKLEKRDEQIAQAIQALQRKSIATRPRRIVVPLRSGVMDFYVPDDSGSNGKHRANFTELI